MNAHRFNIAEENPETASALALLLTAAGYDVETSFGEPTRISVKAAGDELRLIDADAPEFTGRELARQLQRRLDQAIVMPFDDRWEDEAEFEPHRQVRSTVRVA